MEFLDPKRLRKHRILLRIGYGLTTLGIVIGSVILLWEAYGYSIHNGQVVQDGMIFVSSQPTGASIYVNGVLNSATTNTRLTIQSGAYNFKLLLSGYRPWQHVIVNLGGQVVHYDYPFLFPTKLTSKQVTALSSAPVIATQSPSLQYLLLSSPTDLTTFLLYDLTNPTNPPLSLSLPAGIVTPYSGAQSWQVVGWSDDNQHVLLEHIFGSSSEYIELDTANPTQSINLNKTFNFAPTSVSFNNLKYNQFYFYDAASEVLSSAVLGSNNNALTEVASGVLAYKSYSNNEILYVTASGAPAGEVAVDLLDSGTSYLMRYLPQASTYLLDIAGYNGTDYAVVGDSSYSFVDIYKDPVGQATAAPDAKILPFRAIKINQPNYESFAPTAQFIMVENGTTFAVYDILNDVIYHYTSTMPLDPPQLHAQWMDGDRLVYVSGGEVTVADYDNTNRQSLSPALPQYQVFFAPNYQSYFTINNSANAKVELSQVSLLAG